jgi:hypothetical protein
MAPRLLTILTGRNLPAILIVLLGRADKVIMIVLMSEFGTKPTCRGWSDDVLSSRCIRKKKMAPVKGHSPYIFLSVIGLSIIGFFIMW